MRRDEVYGPRTLSAIHVVLDVPTCPGSLPARKDTSLLGFHHSGGSKIDVHSASRDQSVYVIATGGALSFAEKITQPDGGRGRNLGLNDFADCGRNAGSIVAPVVFQVLDVPLQRPIDLCR